MQTLGVLLFTDFELLDVAGPLEMFGQLAELKIQLIAEKSGPTMSKQGVAIYSYFTLETISQLDMLLIPGGQGTRKAVLNATLLDWILDMSRKVSLIMGVCTGAALLAKAGCLDGHQATTNKRAFDWVSQQSTKVNWVKKARWVEERKIFTSSGVAAGIDMSLAVIAKLYGTVRAKEIAAMTEYIWNQDAENDFFYRP